MKSIKEKFDPQKEELILSKKTKAIIFSLLVPLAGINAFNIGFTLSSLSGGRTKQYIEKDFLTLKKSERGLDQTIYWSLLYPGTPGRELIYTLTGNN